MESSSPTDASAAWQPNDELLKMLIDMGISKIAAEHALYYTGNQSAEAAACYVFDNPDIDSMPPLAERMWSRRSKRKTGDEKKTDKKSGSSSEDEEQETEGYKMVFVVNNSLNMGIGKIAAQVAHACLGMYRLVSEFSYMSEAMEDWEEDGEKKIVLKGKDHLHLQELEEIAKKNDLFSYLIHDAGRTQIPSGSVTVLALFGLESKVNNVTGDLGLL